MKRPTFQIPRLKVFRSLWGTDSFSKNYETLVPEIRRLGYTGIEASLNDIGSSQPLRLKYIDCLKRNKLEYICGVYSSWVDYEGKWEDKTIADHLDHFRKQLILAKELDPIGINAHSGSDDWTMEENESYISGALKIEKELSVSVSHETHRGRIFFNPWVTHRLITKFPDLKLTADLSHWVVVSERLLNHDKDERMISQILERVHHVHARVGHAQSAQVSHPQSPEFKEEVDRHQQWFEQIWANHAKSQAAYSTLTPEYGPQPYTPSLPFTRAPVSDAWGVVNLEKARQQLAFHRWQRQLRQQMEEEEKKNNEKNTQTQTQTNK